MLVRRPRWCLLAVVSAVALVAAACKGPAPSGKGGNRRALEFPVEVEPVAARAVEYEVRADGSIDVFERVQITARVAGVVEKIAFREGQHVAAGDLLVTIDADRYELAARQAAAVVARAKAALADAESSLARRRAVEADSPGVVPPEEMEAYQTKVDTARADVTEKQVMLERARLDRRDAYVRAPSAGVIQSRDVVTGSYAQPGTLLATLVQREPLQVRFDVAETDAARIPVGAEVRFTVDGDERDWAAKVTHVAEVADPRSRMVRVSADVTSDGRDALRAGGFAQVVVPVGSRGAAPVIPELSIRPSERGFLVFVVIDGVAHERIVEIGMRTHDGLVEVRSGVAVGDQLVVRGAEALRDGAKVKVVTAAPAP
ncbi:MAG: efflux RND transporter periplasmic adaptor subunit, partial [Myxococcales bacterium]|nr:efflux RND transporter periplasmic adaptor subunit [Myxococcales bacterium]